MGRGAHAALAAFDGSGTQGLASTKIIDEDTKSVFITENDKNKQILHGCNISEMTCIGKSDARSQYKIFTPDKNADLVGDIYLNFEMDSILSNNKFVDSYTNEEYDLDSFDDNSRILNVLTGGEKLGKINLNLNTGDLPDLTITKNTNSTGEVYMNNIGIETIHKTLIVSLTGIGIVEFIVGKPTLLNGKNAAWRLSTASETSWSSFSVPDLEEINDIIYYERPDSNTQTPASKLIFGGKALVNKYLKYLTLGDFTNIVSTSATIIPSHFNDFAGISSALGNYYFETVNTLNYFRDTGIIVSGAKNHSAAPIAFAQPEFLIGAGPPPLTTDRFKQTTITIIDNGSSFTYNKIELFQYLPFNQNWGVDSKVTSTFKDENNYYISTGDKSLDLLGLDEDGKLIRSYDNGKKWERAAFYHGNGLSPNDAGFSSFYPKANLDDTSDVFKYYMPSITKLLSNDKGFWIAIGTQGLQPTAAQSDDKFRHFIFASRNDGHDWHPIKLSIRNFSAGGTDEYQANAEFLDLSQMNSLITIFWKIPGGSTSRTNPGDPALSNDRYVQTVGLQTNIPTPFVANSGASGFWFERGPYFFSESTYNFAYTFYGSISDFKRTLSWGNRDATNGIITLTAHIDTVLTGRPVATETIDFPEKNVMELAYAQRSEILGIFKNTNNNLYQLMGSDFGFFWYNVTIQNNNSMTALQSTILPKLRADIFGNFLLAVYDSNDFKIYIYDKSNKNFNLIIENVFTQIHDLSFVQNEWFVSGIGKTSNDLIIRSHDGFKWRNTAYVNWTESSNTNKKIHKVYSKLMRRYDSLYTISNSGGLSEYVGSNKEAYEIFYNSDAGGGVRPYYDEVVRDPVINYYSLGGNGGHDTSTQGDGFQHEPNDILLDKNLKIIICGNKNPSFNASGTASGHLYMPLVEGTGGTFNEVESIYGTTSNRIPITDYVTDLKVVFEDSRIGSVYVCGNYKESNNVSHGVLLTRFLPTFEQYSAMTAGILYWKLIFGGNPTASYHPSPTPQPSKHWNLSPFEDLHDVSSNVAGDVVIVGKPKDGNGPLSYFMATGVLEDDFININLNFSEINSVCHDGIKWIVAGIPSNDLGNPDPNNKKCIAYSKDLANWTYVDFVDSSNHGDLNPRFFNRVDHGTTSSFTNAVSVNTIHGTHVAPITLDSYSGVLIYISFNHTTTGTYISNGQSWNGEVLDEKVYFMYENNGVVNVKQNSTFTEPKIQYDHRAPYYNSSGAPNRIKQLTKSFTLEIDNKSRTIVSSIYPSEFSQFIISIKVSASNSDAFSISPFNSSYTKSRYTEGGTKLNQKFKKLILTNTLSLKHKIGGQCYKIEKVKSDNFVIGLNSARYVAIGKGKYSSIVWSDDLISWNDIPDMEKIFSIVFDITHKHGYWIAIGDGIYNIALSKDGKKWSGLYSNTSNTVTNTNDVIFNSASIIEEYRTNGSNFNILDVVPYSLNFKGLFLRNLSLLRLFDRVEYTVGTQIWQTLTFDDIKAILDTEMGGAEYLTLSKNASIINKNGSTRFTTLLPGFTKTLNSKLEIFNNISEKNAFPSGLLKDQTLSIKIYYNKLENIIGKEITSSQLNSLDVYLDNRMLNTLIPFPRDSNYFIDSFIGNNYGFQLSDKYSQVNGYYKTVLETDIKRLRLYSKNFDLIDREIEDYRLLRGVGKRTNITQSLYFDLEKKKEILLNLDSFNIYASHLIVSGWLTSANYIESINLELNGYSVHKNLETVILDYPTIFSMGLQYNRYIFNSLDKEDGVGPYIIPLANTAYSGSSVPLDKYDNIKIIIKFNDVTGLKSYINVLCVGETTIEYTDSNANISMY